MDFFILMLSVILGAVSIGTAISFYDSIRDGVLCEYDVDNRNKLKYIFIISLCISFNLIFWFASAHSQTDEFTQRSYAIESETSENGIMYQFSFVDGKIVNITEMFPSVYPDDCKLVKRTYNLWKTGMYLSLKPEYGYIIRDGNGNEHKPVENKNE